MCDFKFRPLTTLILFSSLNIYLFVMCVDVCTCVHAIFMQASEYFEGVVFLFLLCWFKRLNSGHQTEWPILLSKESSLNRITFNYINSFTNHFELKCVYVREWQRMRQRKKRGGVPWHPRGDQRKLSIFAMYFLDIILR